MLTEEQRQQRRLGIGGSDIAAIAGYSDYKTAVDVYLSIVEDIPQSDETEAQWWGSKEEPLIIERYEIKTGNVCVIDKRRFVHPEYPWMSANIDALVDGESIIVEGKTANSRQRQKWGEVGSDYIPNDYLLQCAHYACVLDKNQVDIAVKIDSADFRIYTYKRSAGLEKKLIELERKFWHEHVIPRIPPEAVSLEDAKKLWPLGDEIKAMTANSELMGKCYELLRIKKEKSELEKKEDGLKLLIQSNMQESALLFDALGNKMISWKNQSADRFDITEFKKYNPALYSQFLKESESRVFRLHMKEI